MVLALSTLKDQLEPLFAAPPPTAAECGQAWADAMQAYAVAVVPPSAAVAAAAAALSTQLGAAFATPAAVVAVEAAFTTFAASVGLGMAGYVPVPPPAPVGFAAQIAGPHPETHADAADQFGDMIHAWFTTGTAALISPPSPPVTWS